MKTVSIADEKARIAHDALMAAGCKVCLRPRTKIRGKGAIRMALTPICPDCYICSSCNSNCTECRASI